MAIVWSLMSPPILFSNLKYISRCLVTHPVGTSCKSGSGWNDLCAVNRSPGSGDCSNCRDDEPTEALSCPLLDEAVCGFFLGHASFG